MGHIESGICNCILAAAAPLIQGKTLRDILKKTGICNCILATAASLIQGKTLRDILKVAYVTVSLLLLLP
jgi:hypothetical protein